jgi:molecular chaperone DnaK
MTITGGSGLSKDEIDRMMKDAESHAAEDKARREEADVRNTGESLVYQTEKFIKDNEDKVPAEARSNVEEPLTELKKALEGTDIEAIRTATEKVATASQALGAAMYAQTGAAAGGEGTESASEGDDDVVDAEIVDDEDGKQ